MKNPTPTPTPNAVFLGPVGATFSHDAYDVLAQIYGVPEAPCIPAPTNGDILGMVAEYGGYGAIAMETMAEGRVAEPLESFILLLKVYGGILECPFRVIAAVGLRIHFCLMARTGMSISGITGILAHPKAIGACKGRVGATGLTVEEVKSNGEGARLVVESDEYATYAALGPRSAAEKYGLSILNDAYEDKEAITTFFLLGPQDHGVVIGKNNRILIVFRVPHHPGALVKALTPFDEEGINMIQIHSVHAGNGAYHFAIELEASEADLPRFAKAREKFEKCVEQHLTFGPFEVVSR